MKYYIILIKPVFLSLLFIIFFGHIYSYAYHSLGVLYVDEFLGTTKGVAIATGETKHPVFTTSEGVAIRGYDTVAYFTQKKPVKGTQQYSSVYLGAKWYFSSQEHKYLFKKNPSAYVPQYGGYCAYAMANNYLASINVKAWTIYQGKLYLNASLGVKKNWEKKKDTYIRRANTYWKKYISQ